jgi:tetratricopeptide (TPR) repeat protein
LILILMFCMFCFALAGAGEPVSPAGSNALWSELRLNANRAEKSGDLDAAERYYVQAIQAAANAGVPAGHFAVAEELGQFYWQKANAPAAVTYMRMAVTILRRHFPADSAGKGTALNNLAIVLRGTGSLDESEQNHLEALRVFQNIHSDENVAATYDGLAEVELDRGKYPLAEAYLQKSLAILEKHGLETMTTARSLETLARAYTSVGRTREAEELIPRAEAIFRRNLPSANADFMPFLDTKAVLLYQQQRYAEAERLWKFIIESAQAARPPSIIAAANYHLAEFFAHTKQYGKAQELFEQLLRPNPDGNSNELGRALIGGQLAHVLMQQHKDEHADALFRSAVSTVAASPLNASLPYGIMCVRYGKLKARHKDWREAAGYLERGVKIESEVMPQSGALAEALELSAQVYDKLSRQDAAQDCLNRAKGIRAVLEKARPSNTVDVEALAAEMR